jgi:hypothetical protein
VDGNFLTFIVGIPGAKTHTLLRSLYSEDTLIYSENQNSERAHLFQKFPNHVTYRLADGTKIPHMFDRMRGNEREDHSIWNEIDSRLNMIYKKYNKQILIALHTPIDEIRVRYPMSTIYYIDVSSEDILGCVARHNEFRTHHWNKNHTSVVTNSSPNSTYDSINHSKQYADYIIDYDTL